MAKEARSTRKPWVICEINHQLYALNCKDVKEMMVAPNAAKVPESPNHVRGMINIRGMVFPLVDMRVRLGMTSAETETEGFCQMMAQRAEDHTRWLNELEAAVRENREFKLARDPHQCAFGKWYDSFQTDSIIISNFIKKFDVPHKAVHALADEVMSLVAAGKSQDALAVIETARNGVLASVLALFAQFEALLRDSNREVAVVIDGGGANFAICVDSIESVEHISEATVEALTQKGVEQSSQVVTSVARRNKNDQVVLILDAASILDCAFGKLVPAN